MKVYVVTADAWEMGYGVEMYLIGVFTDKAKADEVAKEYEEDMGIVTEATLDEIYPLKRMDSYWSERSNDKYLGGYVE